jgi:hypothetical protein
MRCERCAGLVVAEQGGAGAGSNGCWVYGEWRCVNCGAMGVSVSASAHPVARGIAGNGKGGGPRRALNTESRRYR